jgi:predicted S18 family serine protease
MSVPDYAEMGRELEANRDATLVNAANRGVKYHEELESANKRIAELKAALKRSDDQGSDLEDIAERAVLAAEARERKLAITVKALRDIQKCQPQWHIPAQALAQIEQPQEKP